MSNPADDVERAVANPQDAKRRLDAHDSVELLRYLHRQERYDGKIATVSKQYTDEYTVDVYESGFTQGDGSDSEPTRRGITCHSVDITEFLEVGCRVKIQILEDNTGIILPSQLPLDTGQYKVLMLIDDRNSGTPAWDYPRFARK